MFDQTGVADSIPENVEKTISYFARLYARPGIEADDLAQQARLLYLTSKSEFDPSYGASISTFLFPRLRGAMLDYIRAEAIRQARSVALDSLPEELSSPEKPGGNLGRLVEHERGELVRAAVRTLPERQRRILKLRYWRGKPLFEIGQRLEMPPSTVFDDHARAVTALRRRFQEA